MYLKNGVLEGSRLDFGGPGVRFWRLRAQFFHNFRMFLAECAENLPRTCRGLAQLVDAYLRSLRFCGLAPLGRDLLRGGGAAVVPPRGFQLNPPHPPKAGRRMELLCTPLFPVGFGSARDLAHSAVLVQKSPSKMAPDIFFDFLAFQKML